MADKFTNTQISRDEVIENIKEILIYLGENPKREGLKNTPERMIKSWNKLLGGYNRDPKKVLSTVFEDGACDELVVLKDIEFYSTCEHHFLPFYGKVHIGYIPDGLVVGISKLARLVEVYSRRLQIQERLTTQIADMINNILNPKGVMVVIEAQHLCMTSRGVEKQNSVMVTNAIRGVFKEEDARQEFMSVIKGR